VTHNPNNFPDADKADRDNAAWMKYLLKHADQTLRIHSAMSLIDQERVVLQHSGQFSLPEIETILFERWRPE
jgi:hypothetical protein